MEKAYTEMFEELPKVAKLLLVIILGAVVGGVYRVLRYVEKKNTTTLIVGALWLITGGFFGIGWVIDIVTEATQNRITFLAD